MYKPFGNKILVKRITASEKTESGFIKPNERVEKILTAEIISIGSGVFDENLAALQNPEHKNIMFSAFAGQEIKLDGVDYFLVPVGDIMVVGK